MSFLRFTGVVDKKDSSFIFRMNKGKDLIENSYINIPNPIIDNSFKQIFGKNNEITKCLLNSILYPNEEKIEKVEFLTNDLPGRIPKYPEPLTLNSLDSIRVDVLCKCFLKNEEFEEEGKKNNTVHMDLDNADKEYIIVDLEIQLGFSFENTKRFIKYAKELDSLYKKDIIVLALVYSGVSKPNKNKGTCICLEQSNLSDYKRVLSFTDYIIYQIDLDFCNNLVLEGKKFWILDENEKIKLKGKEWIKFLTLPSWCDESDTDGYYIFPPLNENFFIGNSIFNAFRILFNQDRLTYQMNLYDFKERERKLLDYYSLTEENKILNKENIELKKELELLKKKIIIKEKK